MFSVAFVCTGNRFRSALAAAAFRSKVDSLPVRVESYGTLDLGAAEPLPVAVGEARAFGLDLSGHLARCLTSADLGNASLVVGFELQHAVAAIDVARARPDRVFLLRELLGLLDPVEAAPPAERIARADARRRAGPRSVPEIDDPIFLPAPEQRAIARAVYEDATALAERLFG